MRVISALLLCFFLVGCVSKEIVFETEYVMVEVPVLFKIERPSRPVLGDKTLPGYIYEIIVYTEKLETIIDSYEK